MTRGPIWLFQEQFGSIRRKMAPRTTQLTTQLTKKKGGGVNLDTLGNAILRVMGPKVNLETLASLADLQGIIEQGKKLGSPEFDIRQAMFVWCGVTGALAYAYWTW